VRRRELIWRLAAAVVVEVGGIGKLGGERRVELEFSKLIWCFFFLRMNLVFVCCTAEREISGGLFIFFPVAGNGERC
jgi:hypothetical protein